MRSERLKYYPVAVKLKKRLAIVVGGGKVAERKAEALRGSGATVRLISPKATPHLRRLARDKKIVWIKRRFHRNDTAGAHIIVAATNDPETNALVSHWAQRRKIWVNVVDKPVLSDFISPAVFRAENAIITVYTDGRDPVLSRDVKNFLKERWDDFLSYRNRS